MNNTNFTSLTLIPPGQCGFPGRPMNGKVYRVDNSSELGRGAVGVQGGVTEEISENSWNKQELYRVVYRCDDDSLMGTGGESDYFRECVDGMWTGENPRGECRA